MLPSYSRFLLERSYLVNLWQNLAEFIKAQDAPFSAIRKVHQFHSPIWFIEVHILYVCQKLSPLQAMVAKIFIVDLSVNPWVFRPFAKYEVCWALCCAIFTKRCHPWKERCVILIASTVLDPYSQVLKNLLLATLLCIFDKKKSNFRRWILGIYKSAWEAKLICCDLFIES